MLQHCHINTQRTRAENLYVDLGYRPHMRGSDTLCSSVGELAGSHMEANINKCMTSIGARDFNAFVFILIIQKETLNINILLVNIK